MVEKKRDMQVLSFQWGVLGGHAAVAAGAFTALVSLFRGVSLSSACIRGIICVFVLRVVFYMIRTLLELFGEPETPTESASQIHRRTLSRGGD
jgi:hypothetical protein